MMTGKRKIEGIARIINDTYNTKYNHEIIVKEIKCTNNNNKFRESIFQEERLSKARIFIVI